MWSVSFSLEHFHNPATTHTLLRRAVLPRPWPLPPSPTYTGCRDSVIVMTTRPDYQPPAPGPLEGLSLSETGWFSPPFASNL